MIKIKTKHGGVGDVEIGEDGHWSYTYIPQSEDDFACIVHSGIPADEVITNLQLEDGTRATHWVPNTVEESELAKLWNSQREIRLNFTNELEQLEGKVQIRTDGILTEFKDLETKTESSIIQTANNIRAEVKDDINKLEGRINLNAHGLESKFEDHKRQMSSQLIQTSDLFQTKLTDQEKQFNSKITQTSQGIRSEVNDVERTLNSRITQTSEGIKSEVSDVKRGLESQISQTSSGLTSSINSLESKTRSLINQTSNSLSATIDSKTRGVKTDIMADLDRILLAVKDNNRLTDSSLELTKNRMRSAISNTSESAIRTMVPSMIEDKVNGINYRSIFQQQADNIMWAIGDKIPEGKMTANEIVSTINLSPTGVRIRGDRITLDGSTTMTNAFAKKLMVDELEAGDIEAFMGRFGSVVAKNIDVTYLTGDYAQFVSLGMEALNSNATLDGQRFRIDNDDGSFIEMNNIPEFRTEDPRGTGTVLGDGRVHFLDTRGYSRGYMGTELHTTSNDFGIFLSAGTGKFAINIPGFSDKQYVTYYTVKSGDTWSSIAARYGTTMYQLARMNGSNVNARLYIGQRLKVREYTEQVSSGRVDAFAIGMNQEGQEYRTYFRTRVRMEKDLTVEDQAYFKGRVESNNFMKATAFHTTSDRRLKENIRPTEVIGLDIIKDLDFVEYQWKENHSHVDIGLIAQDEPDLSVYDEQGDSYMINTSKAVMTALKAIQELERKVATLENELC